MEWRSRHDRSEEQAYVSYCPHSSIPPTHHFLHGLLCTATLPRHLSPAQMRNSLGIVSLTRWVTYVAHLMPHSSASWPYVFWPSQLCAYDPMHSD